MSLSTALRALDRQRHLVVDGWANSTSGFIVMIAIYSTAWLAWATANWLRLLPRRSAARIAWTCGAVLNDPDVFLFEFNFESFLFLLPKSQL